MYNGEWQKGKKNGQAQVYYSDMERTVNPCTFLDDKPLGGEMILKDGQYHGEINDSGMRHGSG